MRILTSCTLLLGLSTCVEKGSHFVVNAKKSSRSAGSPTRRASVSSQSRLNKSAPVSRRRVFHDDDDEDEDDEFAVPFAQNDMEDEYDEEEDTPKSIQTKKRRGGGQGATRSSRKPPRGNKPPPSRKRPARSSRERYEEEYDYEDDEEEDDRMPPSRSSRGRTSYSRGGSHPRYRDTGRRRRSGGKVVPYGATAPSTFTRGLTALRESIPDPSTVRNAAASTLSAARETTSKFSTQIYREVKGLTSSELEQVMLKATRPDDTPVKGKHVERLVGVTYQISPRYDIYDAVLRKLWKKMTEKDWRTTIKALYILHRFSADGAPEHAAALKARLRELRRTRDPKSKDKLFNSKQLLSGNSTPENVKYRAFMSRYAHYVLLRAQCFGGMFDEISRDPAAGKVKKGQKAKPRTSTSLRPENLEAATLVLKAGLACALKDGEECENTAIAAERVASDLIGLTAAVAMAINRALKADSLNGADPELLKRWCEFYSEQLLPETKAMVKRTSAKLDAYGLFLPSRMGTSVPQGVLQKGLRAEELLKETEEGDEETTEAEGVEEDDEEKKVEAGEEKASTPEDTIEGKDAIEDQQEEETAMEEEDNEEYEEYDYEEEEYYDDEES